MEDVKVFSTPILDGIRIIEYKGLVITENVRAINIIRDIFTKFRDIFGGRSDSYQAVIAQMRDEAVAEMKAKALALGANAVVSFDIDWDNIGSKGKSLLMAVAKGTAVVIELSS